MYKFARSRDAMQVVRGIEAAGSFPIQRSARTGKIATVAVYAPANKVATPSWHPAQTSSRLHNLQEKSLMQAFCFRNPVRFRNPISAIPLNLTSDIIDVIAKTALIQKLFQADDEICGLAHCLCGGEELTREFHLPEGIFEPCELLKRSATPESQY